MRDEYYYKRKRTKLVHCTWGYTKRKKVFHFQHSKYLKSSKNSSARMIWVWAHINTDTLQNVCRFLLPSTLALSSHLTMSWKVAFANIKVNEILKRREANRERKREREKKTRKWKWWRAYNSPKLHIQTALKSFFFCTTFLYPNVSLMASATFTSFTSLSTNARTHTRVCIQSDT